MNVVINQSQFSFLKWYLVVRINAHNNNCMITGGKTSLSVDTALGPNVSRGPATTTQVLPLAVAGWTLGSVNTLEVTPATYHLTGTPGAVTVSVQIYVIAVPEDWPELFSGHISPKIGWPLLSCYSGGRQCD